MIGLRGQGSIQGLQDRPSSTVLGDHFSLHTRFFGLHRLHRPYLTFYKWFKDLRLDLDLPLVILYHIPIVITGMFSEILLSSDKLSRYRSYVNIRWKLGLYDVIPPTTGKKVGYIQIIYSGLPQRVHWGNLYVGVLICSGRKFQILLSTNSST